jgi:tetratricopeptide (TPR) repeat protein
LDNIFEVQADIANKVVAELRLTLLGGGLRSRETSPEAYNLYLQASYLDDQFSVEASKQAALLYQQVLAIDPKYVPALSGLALVYSNRATLGEADADEAWELAHETIYQALAINPADLSTRLALIRIKIGLDYDIQAGITILEEVLASNPSSSEAIALARGVLHSLGRLDEAVAITEYLVARDPASASIHRAMGKLYLDAGQFEKAEGAFRTALVLSPNGRTLNHNLGRALMLQGKLDEALTTMKAEPRNFYRRLGLAMIDCDLDRSAEAETTMEELVSESGDDAEYRAYQFAFAFAYCGQADRSFEWLSFITEPSDAPLSLSSEVLFTKLHDDPRWIPFLESIGQSPDQLARIEFNTPQW